MRIFKTNRVLKFPVFCFCAMTKKQRVSMDSHKLTQEVKDLAKRSGAALVGVASIDRFEPRLPYYDRIPKGQDPRDFLPEAKSVISIAMPLLNPAVDRHNQINQRDSR